MKLKNASILRNIPSLGPELRNSTRWSEKYRMLRQFLLMFDELIEASENVEANIPVNTSETFMSKIA